MKLVQFSLEKFRNFVDKQTINFTNNSVIIGPNNGGKTNILRALIISWDFLMGIAVGRNLCSFVNNELVCNECKPNSNKDIVDQTTENEPFSVYNWQRDYPVSLQEENPKDILNKTSTFILYFQLTNEEVIEINNILHSSTSISPLQICFSMGINRFSLSFPSMIVTDSSIQEMVKYVAKKISIFYIDAVRTARGALSMINNLLEAELQKVYKSKEYLFAEEQLNNLLYPSLENLLNILNQRIKFFASSIHENSLTYYHSNRPLRDLRLFLDDGNSTEISQKGSGIQSLVAISLAQIISSNKIHSDSLVLVVEEPEAHLHPKAIHEIKKVLSDIAKNNQLIITTHSPLLACTTDIKSNTIISNNNVHQATSLKDIRETLGVFASDNLLFADNNILVEGISDKIILERILSSLSKRIAKAIENGTLVIYNCQGSSKVSAFVSLTQRFFYKSYIVLDNDKAGEKEKNNLINTDPTLLNKISSLAVPGMNESEIEDFIKPSSYADEFIKLFGFGTKKQWIHNLSRSKRRWSDTLKIFLNKNQCSINELLRIHAKTIVSDTVINNGLSALKPRCKIVFKNLAANIEKMLDE